MCFVVENWILNLYFWDKKRWMVCYLEPSSELLCREVFLVSGGSFNLFFYKSRMYIQASVWLNVSIVLNIVLWNESLIHQEKTGWYFLSLSQTHCRKGRYSVTNNNSSLLYSFVTNYLNLLLIFHMFYFSLLTNLLWTR